MLRPYVRMYVCHVRNPSLRNVTFYIQVYIQVYLHIYIEFHIYVQAADTCNFDNFYATKLKFDVYLLRPGLDHGRVAPGA